MKQADFWNDTNAAELRVLWDEGDTTSAIGRQLGCTKGAVIGKASRMGLARRKGNFAVPHENREQAIDLIAARQLNDGEISRIVGMSPDGIRKIRVKMGFKAMVQCGTPKAIKPQTTKVEVRRKIQPVLNIGQFQCTFLIGDEKPWSACPDNALVGRSYCEHHMKVCYFARGWTREAA